jgi:hypothetical protein
LQWHCWCLPTYPAGRSIHFRLLEARVTVNL